MHSMGSKTLKVSEVVYDTLEARKGKNETFDDVLRRELGLDPGLQDVAAYLPDETREVVLELVEEIDELADFDHTVETKGASAYYEFVSPDSGLTIAVAEFSSGNGSSAVFRYRQMDGDMIYITSIHSDRDTDSKFDLNTDLEFDELVEKISEPIEGAVRKWY